jgi:hypothetical protein
MSAPEVDCAVSVPEVDCVVSETGAAVGEGPAG